MTKGAMTRRVRVQWTPEEDAELRRIYAMSSAGLSAAALKKLAETKSVKRSHCRHRAARLGILRVAGAHRRWTQAEIENLQAYAGRLSIRKIARILARTDEAVQMQIWRMRLSQRVKERGYTRTELAELLGVDLEHTMASLLKRFPMKANLLGNFNESEVQLWIWDHLEDLELRKCNQPWLKALLRSAA